MKDIRATLIKALLPAIKTATGKDAYTRIPKAAAVTYPYIYISDIYQEENGPKTKPQYLLDVLIQVVYQDVNNLTALFTDMDNLLSIINNDVPFALDSPYKILECRLNNSATTEIETTTGVQNIGMVRVWFDVE